MSSCCFLGLLASSGSETYAIHHSSEVCWIYKSAKPLGIEFIACSLETKRSCVRNIEVC